MVNEWCKSEPRNTVAISKPEVSNALRSARPLPSPMPTRSSAETSSMSRMGQYQSTENIRNDSWKAGCPKRCASARLRISCPTGRRNLIAR